VEGRAREGAVRLFDDDDIDRASKSRGVDLVVEETEVADDLGDIVHAVHVLSPRTAGRGNSTDEEERGTMQRSVVRNSRRGERETYSRLSSGPKVACERERIGVILFCEEPRRGFRDYFRSADLPRSRDDLLTALRPIPLNSLTP